MMDVSKVITIVEHTVVICSVCSIMLPPLEWFNKWPKFQNYYKLALVVITHYGSLNLRGMVWSSQIGNGDLSAPVQLTPVPPPPNP